MLFKLKMYQSKSLCFTNKCSVVCQSVIIPCTLRSTQKNAYWVVRVRIIIRLTIVPIGIVKRRLIFPSPCIGII